MGTDRSKRSSSLADPYADPDADPAWTEAGDLSIDPADAGDLDETYGEATEPAASERRRARPRVDEDEDDGGDGGYGGGGDGGGDDDGGVVRWGDGARSPFAARIGLGVVFGAALLGLLFAGVSTADFVKHLDRQVHAVHCSIIPGAGAQLGDSGCRTVMLSPYSSFFRTDLWGGLPVSLWALAVFAFLAYRAGWGTWRGGVRRGEALFLVAATLLPVGMSILYGYLAVAHVQATCKVCVGIYVASALALGGALAAWWFAPRTYEAGGAALHVQRFAVGIGEGVGFVLALTLAYLAFVPAADAEKTTKGCGTLVQPADTAGVMLSISPAQGGTPAIEVLDPLCPSCRAFEARFEASGFRDAVDLKAVLFPLDSTCNWMVGQSLHPGACAVSEAMLCVATSGGSPRAVMEWAFANQESLIADARADEARVRERIVSQFPSVKGCLGGPQVKNKLTRSLRWAVANALPVLTPQLFIDGARVCDEDTDLGLEYTLARMLARRGGRS